jgi:ABC-type oligopeptide transport system substrate-binding subunit
MNLRQLLVAAIAAAFVMALAGSSALAAGESIVVETSPLTPTNPTQWIDYSIATTQAAWLLNAATCLKLLDYDEETGDLEPEAAVAMPSVSPDGMTYTFNVRPGQALAGGPAPPVDADAFKRAIERATSPAMQASIAAWPTLPVGASTIPPARSIVSGIVGAPAFYANTASSISGVQAAGNVLTIQLSNPDPTFPKRIAMPYFCATRADAPAGYTGAAPHSGGPYFVMSPSASGSGAPGDPFQHTIVLKRNTAYTGDRIQNLGTISFVQQGSPLAEDYVAAAPLSYSPPAGVQIVPTITTTIQLMALNTSRPTFSSVTTRRAASFAVDRVALSGVLGWQPTDQFVSPLLDGYEEANVFPLTGNQATATALLAGATPTVTFCHDTGRAAVAALAEAQLEAVGFQVTRVNPTQSPIFANYFTYIANPANCDIAVSGFSPAYPDLSVLLSTLFYGGSPSNFSFYSDAGFNARFDAAPAITPESARLHEYADLDADIAGEAPAIAMGYNLRRDAFADRIGCRIVNHVLVGYAVNRLCIEVTETAIPGGLPVSTGDDATPEAPLQTSVAVPAGGTGGDVTITQGQSDASELPVFKLLEQELDISAPAQTPANPLELTFEIDAQALVDAGLSIGAVVVYRNGSPVPNCTDPGATAAVPDPCVESRTSDAQGDGVIVVRTSQASTWNFGGFTATGPFSPVDPQPTVNTMNAGRTVPVKFSLGGNFGLGILADGYPVSQQVACAGGAPQDDVESTSSTGSGLSYDASSGRYQYNWKTQKGWAGQCRTLILKFDDGQELKASFKFK